MPSPPVDCGGTVFVVSVTPPLLALSYSWSGGHGHPEDNQAVCDDKAVGTQIRNGQPRKSSGSGMTTLN